MSSERPNKDSDTRSEDTYALEEKGFFIGKKIGQGSYATVRTATYMDRNSCKVMKLACKILDKDKSPGDFFMKFFPRELDILTKLNSPHIVQVHSIMQRGPKTYIFMKYADNGDLLDFIRKSGPTPEVRAHLWFSQMLGGLEYLHERNIAHRDLKCENILITRNFNVRLTDFGFARYTVDNNNRNILSKTYCGSAAYAAPEVIRGVPYNPKLADIWSLGIITFIMLNASMPFDDSDVRKLFKEQMGRKWQFRSKIRNTLSASSKNLVTLILEPNPSKRIRIPDIRNHDWLHKKPSNRHRTLPQFYNSSSQVTKTRNMSTGLDKMYTYPNQ